MKKKSILIFLIALSYNLAFSQNFYTYKTPGFLGKKFYITGGGGISPFNIDKEITNCLSYYGGINYTLGKKTDIGTTTIIPAKSLCIQRLMQLKQGSQCQWISKGQ